MIGKTISGLDDELIYFTDGTALYRESGVELTAEQVKERKLREELDALHSRVVGLMDRAYRACSCAGRVALQRAGTVETPEPDRALDQKYIDAGLMLTAPVYCRRCGHEWCHEHDGKEGTWSQRATPTAVFDVSARHHFSREMMEGLYESSPLLDMIGQGQGNCRRAPPQGCQRRCRKAGGRTMTGTSHQYRPLRIAVVS